MFTVTSQQWNLYINKYVFHFEISYDQTYKIANVLQHKYALILKTAKYYVHRSTVIYIKWLWKRVVFVWIL